MNIDDKIILIGLVVLLLIIGKPLSLVGFMPYENKTLETTTEDRLVYVCEYPKCVVKAYSRVYSPASTYKVLSVGLRGGRCDQLFDDCYCWAGSGTQRKETGETEVGEGATLNVTVTQSDKDCQITDKEIYRIDNITLTVQGHIPMPPPSIDNIWEIFNNLFAQIWEALKQLLEWV